MTTRLMNSGRFGYAMGYKSRQAAEDAFCNMCNEGEMSPSEAEIESYNASNSPDKRVTRWAITTTA